MPDLLVYGKIILDTLRLPSGKSVTGLLGGGGPQGVWGARLFVPSVGFLTRTGTDLEAQHISQLRALDVDLGGWRQYPHLSTPELRMSYDENENMLDETGNPVPVVRWEGNWARLLAQTIDWPPAYQQARGIHLITEIPDETMVEEALALRDRTGALVSLEPLIDIHGWSNLDAMMELVSRVDVVCPDSVAACHVAGVNDPAQAAQHWCGLGPSFVAVRAGARGSFLASRDMEQGLHLPAMAVRVEDPTGAGNAFAGGLVASLLTGADLPRAACQATAAAALMLELVGMPIYSEVAAHRARALAHHHFHSHFGV